VYPQVGGGGRKKNKENRPKRDNGKGFFTLIKSQGDKPSGPIKMKIGGSKKRVMGPKKKNGGKVYTKTTPPWGRSGGVATATFKKGWGKKKKP